MERVSKIKGEDLKRQSRFSLALSVVIFDEVLQEVHSLLRLDLVDFDQILFGHRGAELSVKLVAVNQTR